MRTHIYIYIYIYDPGLRPPGPPPHPMVWSPSRPATRQPAIQQPDNLLQRPASQPASPHGYPKKYCQLSRAPEDVSNSGLKWVRWEP